MTITASRAGRSRRAVFILTVAVLSAIPVTAGALRLMQLAGGPDLIPADQRISEAPAPVIIHIVGSAVYLLLGALQFVPALRRRPARWHRRAGRVVLLAGILVAGSALWMTLFYAAKDDTGPILYAARIFFSIGMAFALLRAVAAIRSRDVGAHRAWMIRAYAIGLAAGTQAFTQGATEALFGTGVLTGDLAKLGGWVINLAVAEWLIRRMRRDGLRVPAPVPG